MFQSLRSRLLLLVVAASLPALVWFSFSAAWDRRRSAAIAQADLLRLARRAADAQVQFVDQAEAMLAELAHHARSTRNNPPLCRDLYPSLELQFKLFSPRFLNLGAIDPTGTIYCSVDINTGSTAVGQQAYFAAATRSLDFVVGDYEFDDTTGKVFVNFGYPVLDFDDQIRAVIFATLDLDWLNEFYTETSLSPKSTFTVLDRHGVILLRHPDSERWVGRTISQPAIVNAVLNKQPGGTLQAVDEGDVSFLYAFEPLHSNTGYEAYVVIGIPEAEIAAQADAVFYQNLIGLGVVTGLMVLGAWLGSEWFVLRQVRSLLRATQQVGQGNLTARSGLARTAGELGQLGRAFDHMSSVLEQRDHERQLTQGIIQQQTARASALARVASRLNAQLDPDAVLQAICEETAQALAVPMVVVGLFDPRRDELYPAAGQGLPEDFQAVRPPWPKSFYEQAFQRRGPLIVMPALDQIAQSWPQVRPYLALGVEAILIAQIQHQKELIGILAVATLDASRSFTMDEHKLLQGVADQAAQAIANASLLAETEHRARELTALYEITHDLSTQQYLPTVLNLILERTSGLLDVSLSSLYLYDHHRGDLELIVAYGTVAQPGDRMILGEGLIGKVARDRQPFMVRDYEHWEHRLSANSEPGLTSAMAVPLLYGGDLIGVMAVGVVESIVARRMFTDADQRLLVLIAGHAASAIRNTRLYEAEQLARQKAETLRTANLALTRLLDLDAVLRTLLDYLTRLVPYDTACIMLLEDETRLVVRATAGYDRWAEIEPIQGQTFELKDLPLNHAMLTEMTSRLIPDTIQEADWRWLAGGEHIRSWLGVPLMVGGHVLGLFSLDKLQPNFFSLEHLHAAEAIALQAAFAIRNVQLFEEVRLNQGRLRQLAQQVVAAQEAERQRVSRELHDEAGQTLVALKFQLDIIRDELPAESGRLADQISKTAALIETTMHRVRLLAHNLRPPALDTVGLNRVLEDMCYEYAHQTQLSVHYTGEELPQLSSELSIGLYRLLQEALTNVVKHAQARQVQVRLGSENGHIHLCVEDDGQGFDWVARRADPLTQGIGLLGMQERIQLLNGELQIESSPEGGTRLLVRVPWAEGN